MLKTTKSNSEEINLFDLINILWTGKWKIALCIIISMIIGISYNWQNNKVKNFTAITKISSVPQQEINKYIEFNKINQISLNVNTKDVYLEKVKSGSEVNSYINRIFLKKEIDESKDKNIVDEMFNISKSKLLNLFVDELNEKKIFLDAIRKFNLLDAKNYKDEAEYNKATANLASKIKILKPTFDINNGKLTSKFPYYAIKFKYHDSEKWRNVLKYVNSSTNKKVLQNLQEHFRTLILIEKKNREYNLEDLTIKIDNLIIDHDRKTSDRILYLKEQSSIAKTLGIAKNTIEVLTLGNQNALLNVQTDSPFYLRGYEAIDKEIELINLRLDNNAFVLGLLELEQDKRNFNQNKTLERVEKIFKKTPLYEDSNFFASTINVFGTNYEYKKDTKLIPIYFIIGLIIGLLYVFINNEIQPHKVFKKKVN
jgi:LPS O-antigen subunit length determinant protein (WzzB/FepE family)